MFEPIRVAPSGSAASPPHSYPSVYDEGNNRISLNMVSEAWSEGFELGFEIEDEIEKKMG